MGVGYDSLGSAVALGHFGKVDDYMPKVEEPEKLLTYGRGATRSDKWEGVRIDLIPDVAVLREGKRWGVGAAKHGENNWQLGMPLKEIWKHFFGHIYAYRSGDRTDDHLAAAKWALSALMWYEDHPEARAPEDAPSQN